MNLYGLKYGISMTLEELLNKEVIVSMPDKIIKLKEFYNDTGDLEDLKYSITHISDFNEALFNNLLTKNKFLNMCKKSYNRYKTKIEHVIQHIIDDKSKLNEGLVHFIPSHHIDRIKNRKQ